MKPRTTRARTSKKPKYPDSFKQVIKKCKRLFVKYLEQSIGCGKKPELMRSKNSPHVELDYQLEDKDWKNLLADSILKNLQSQINIHGVDYSQLDVSVLITKSSGILNIKSPGSDLNLPFKVNKK